MQRRTKNMTLSISPFVFRWVVEQNHFINSYHIVVFVSLLKVKANLDKELVL